MYTFKKQDFIHSCEYIFNISDSLSLVYLPLYFLDTAPPPDFMLSFYIPMSLVIAIHVCTGMGPFIVTCVSGFLCCFRGIKLSPCVCPRTCVLHLSHSSGPIGVIFGVSKNLVHISLIHMLCWKFSSLNIVFKHSIPNSLRKDTNLYLLVSLMQCLAYCRNLINA